MHTWNTMIYPKGYYFTKDLHYLYYVNSDKYPFARFVRITSPGNILPDNDVSENPFTFFDMKKSKLSKFNLELLMRSKFMNIELSKDQCKFISDALLWSIGEK